MRLVDAHLRPAVQIDSKTIEAYYRDKFVPQLKQSGVGDVPLADVSAKIRELLTEEKVNELMVSWLQSLAFGEQGQRTRHCRVSRGGSADAVTEPAARPRRWWKYLLIFLGAALLFGLAALWYITTDSFQSYVRGRLVQKSSASPAAAPKSAVSMLFRSTCRSKSGTSPCMAKEPAPMFRLPTPIACWRS